MTGANFLILILKLADKNSNDTEYKTLALEWLNLVLKDIQSRQEGFHWRFLEKTATTPTVASQYNYQLPSDIDTTKITHVYDRTNDITYTFAPYDIFVKRVADPTASGGDPFIFTIWAEELWLYPTPDSEITVYIDYIQDITALADDGNSCEIPAKYDKTIIAGVMVDVYEFDPDLGDSLKKERQYEAGITRMRNENAVQVADMGRPVSHRAKHMAKSDIDGKHSTLFPTESTNF